MPKGSAAYRRGYRAGKRAGRRRKKGKGGRGGGLGSFGRLVRGYFLAREVEHIAESEIRYDQAYSQAGSSEARYAAEKGLQGSIFSTPLIGPLLQAATLFDSPWGGSLGWKGTIGTENTIAAAQQQAQYIATMQQSMLFAQQLSQQAGVAEAGSGTDEQRRREIEKQRADDELRIKKDNADRQAQLDEKYQRAESKIQEEREDEEAHKDWIGYKSPYDTAGEEETAQRDKRPGYIKPTPGMLNPDEGTDALQRQARKERADADAIEEAHRKDLQYDIQRGYRVAGEQRDVALLERGTDIGGGVYKPLPDVATARQTYNTGYDQAQDLEHQGRGAQAREVLEATTARLQKQQFDLKYGGSVGGDENFGMAGIGELAPTPGGIGRAHADDTAEALAEIVRLLAALLHEQETLPDKL